MLLYKQNNTFSTKIQSPMLFLCPSTQRPIQRLHNHHLYYFKHSFCIPKRERRSDKQTFINFCVIQSRNNILRSRVVVYINTLFVVFKKTAFTRACFFGCLLGLRIRCIHFLLILPALVRGPFINYVTQFWPIFDPLPPPP